MKEVGSGEIFFSQPTFDSASMRYQLIKFLREANLSFLRYNVNLNITKAGSSTDFPFSFTVIFLISREFISFIQGDTLGARKRKQPADVSMIQSSA